MSAKACTSGKTVLDLWKLADSTDRQLYTVKRSVGNNPSIIGVRRAPGSGCPSPIGTLHPWRDADTRATAVVPLQVNVTIVDVGRTTEGCAAYLSVGSASIGWCQTTTSGLGTASSPGAASWLLENVPGQPGYVYISNEARRAAGCAMRYLGASATNCSATETGLYALANPNAILTWQLIRV